ncbi:unnamed protein product [Blepharisma stoltei]|uniref:BOS complex subunit TMEM147 n=1 Tax=Blepharisma stoltei TaxID=1481888 RepID=A0AAU9JDL9_9CILI|nr:unnamed protein product [Blepharisma stoltei]
MDVLHLINCFILSFGPIFIIFRTTRLRLYGVRTLISGFVGYIISAMFSLIFIDFNTKLKESRPIYAELITGLAGFVDVFILQAIFSWRSTKIGDKNIKMISAGLGWASAKIIAGYLISIISTSKESEFSWDFIQKSILANCEIGQMIAFACLVWVTVNGNKPERLIAWLLISVKVLIFPLSKEVLLIKHFIGIWGSLVFEGAFSIILVLVTKLLVDLAIL